MKSRAAHTAFLVLLAAVFTIGLTFVTVELPYLIDEALQGAITMPNLDSHADEMSVLKTELFISHFHLRTIGYICFALMVAAIVVGFSTRKTGLATLGAIGFMLPVFAQFASVMFFLSGLGILNVLWLPVLDISYDLQRLGLVIRAPYDLLRWLFGLVGVNGYWPIVYLFLGGGLLLFFLGTFAWLSARARKQEVADFWVYRLSRHPQYLGWILWSYGVYLLLLQLLYPKRSWGIDASLPWLLSTLVIIGVAMLEELQMRQRHGDAYETYRRSAPFLFPVPRFVEKLFALPTRWLFKKAQPDRKREVAAVVGFYALLLIGASALFYGSGLKQAESLVRPSAQRATMDQLVVRLLEEPDARRKFFIAGDLASYGEPAVDYFIPLLQNEQLDVRINAVDYLRQLGSERAVPALVAALGDSVAGVRWRALYALGAIGSSDCTGPMLPLLDDPDAYVRHAALRSLARLGSPEVVAASELPLQNPDPWVRMAGIDALASLGSADGVPLLIERLSDEKEWVRRSVVAALLRIGSPLAVDALQRAARDDEDWEVRLYAAEALKQLDAR